VGLAPGLTNLLASHCTAVLEEVHNVDIFLLLGMGEVHGESSNQWVLDNLNSEYHVRQSGEEKRVQAFGEFKRTVFPGDAGKRSAFRFNFSDQHTVVRTLGIDSASTWTCFDSAFFTWFFYVEKKLGLLSLLRFATVKGMYLKLLGSIHMGSDVFIAQVVANGTANGKPTSYTCSVSGHGEGRITGLVAADVAEHLCTSTTPPGVFHIEQLFDQPKEFIERFSKRVTDLEYRF
jgi:saccharopine dehydrogenase-like NADP-dependent oxidoreductase